MPLQPLSSPDVNGNPLLMGILLITPGLLTGLAMTGLVPVLPAIEHDFRASVAIDFLGKLVISIVGLSVMIGAPLANLLTVRFGFAKVLFWALALFGISALASAAAPDVAMLIGARFLAGMSAAIVVTIAVSLIGLTGDPATRSNRIGYHMAFAALSMFVLLPLSGALGTISWRMSALIGLIGFCYLPLVFRMRHALSAERLLAGTAGTAREGSTGVPRLAILTIVALALIVGLGTYSGPAFQPFKAAMIGIDDPWRISLLGTVGMVGALSSFFYGTLVTRLGLRSLSLCIYALLIGGCLLVAVARDAAMLIVANALMGIGGGLAIAHLYALASTLFAPSKRVFIVGAVKAASFLGLFLGPLGLQLVRQRTSLDFVFVTMALICAFGLVLAFVISGWRNRPTLI